MKQCIYHLHIPRTSGVLIRQVLKNQNLGMSIVSGHLDKISLSQFESANLISGHYGTLPIKYSDKTFAIIREPIERTFSYLKYIWSHFYSDMAIQELFDLYMSDQKLSSSISNQQFKFLTNSIDIEQYNKNIFNLKNMVENNWYLNSASASMNDLVSSTYINNIEILDYKSNTLYSDIAKIIGVEYNDKLFINKINSSTFMSKDMQSKYYDEIAKLNILDLELYESFKS
jgi:hypothetical protein